MGATLKKKSVTIRKFLSSFETETSYSILERLTLLICLRAICTATWEDFQAQLEKGIISNTLLEEHSDKETGPSDFLLRSFFSDIFFHQMVSRMVKPKCPKIFYGTSQVLKKVLFMLRSFYAL